ncbi:phage tail assembly chaperone [Rhizobium nepotum]|uniref:phage tail assembly chaperone n=1 Tax=Rhizobium nepotum TaxID=1035271 RepID=UPI003CF84863
MNLESLLCAELKRQLEANGVRDTRIPSGGELLWKWFMALHKTRQAGMAGPQPITYAEIVGYAHLMRQPIEPRHVAILIAMDQAYLETVYKKQPQAPDGVKVLPPVSSAAISAGAFDAMFGGQ